MCVCVCLSVYDEWDRWYGVREVGREGVKRDKGVNREIGSLHLSLVCYYPSYICIILLTYSGWDGTLCGP